MALHACFEQCVLKLKTSRHHRAVDFLRKQRGNRNGGGESYYL